MFRGVPEEKLLSYSVQKILNRARVGPNNLKLITALSLMELSTIFAYDEGEMIGGQLG